MFKKLELIAHRREKDGATQSLSVHLTEVSSLAGKFSSKIGLKKQGELLGFLHDIGKASEEFQKYIKSATGLINPDEDDYVDVKGLKGKVDHSTAGAQIIQRKLSETGHEGAITAQVLALCIASHHSGMIDCLLPEGKNNFQRRMEKSEEKVHVEEVLGSLNEDGQKMLASFLDQKLEKSLLKVMLNLKEENDSKETLIFKYGLLVRFLLSCLLDADRLNTADFEFPENLKIRNQNKYLSWNVLIERFNSKKFKSRNQKVDALRSRISQQCFEFALKQKGRIYQLTVPTGGGKTFASLRFALNHVQKHKMDRIIYVIPYTSIIDQNAEEVRKVLETRDAKGRYLDEVVLEHHSNLTPEEETCRQGLLSENWDAPIVFTTNVQFLEALFSSGTRGARRMHQLANTVIVFDEVQTIPIRCVHMFNVALRFLTKNCNSTVVLCTATQPLLDKIEIKNRSLQISPEQQMMKNVHDLFADLKRVEIHDERKAGGWTEDEIVDLAWKELQTTGSVLIIVNTKASAKYLYQKFKIKGLENIVHLSTDMCPAHRMNVLNKIEDCLGKDPLICVSTQLIEAGIDVDFGSVIRYLAGLDSIAQAAGRCNRHGLRDYGNVYIVNPKNENLGPLKEIMLGAQNAKRVLDEFKDTQEKFNNEILSPLLMEQYYKYYFYERKNEMNFPITSKSAVGREDNLFELLSTNSKSIQEHQRIHQSVCVLPLKQSFHSAAKAFHVIDTLTQGVIVPYGTEGKEIIEALCSAYLIEKQYKVIKKAQRFSVNVYGNKFNKLAGKKAIREVQQGAGIFYLDSQYYSDEFGLSETPVKEMDFLNG